MGHDPQGDARAEPGDRSGAVDSEEQEEIRAYTWQYLDVFDYKSFLG